MSNKATIPIVAVAIIALVSLLIWLGVKNLSGPSAVPTSEAGYPPFIDPSTNRPWAPGKGPNAAPGGGQAGAGGATTNDAPKGRVGSGSMANMRTGR